MTAGPSLDSGPLAADLRDVVSGEVRFDDASRGLYATDASNYRMVPIGVVVPRSVDDVVATVDVCRAHDAPLLSRGGGTSLAGQCCNVAVVLDWSKYLRRVVSVDAHDRRARVEPGCVLDDLRDATAEHGLTFGPDPATHDHCTLGGMIGNNSCGVHSVMAGRTVDNVASLEVLTYDGLRMTVGPTSDDDLAEILAAGGRRAEIYGALARLRDEYADDIRARFPRDLPRRVSGYNLDELLPERGFHVARALVGTEGTCVTVLGAELDLVDSPPARSLLVLGFPDVGSAGDRIPDVMAAGPCGCEGIDRRLFDLSCRLGLHPDALSLLPDGNAWLLVEFGGADKSESDAAAHALMERLRHGDDAPTMDLFDDPESEQQVWEVRESGLGATAHPPGHHDAWPGWEDSAVPPERVGDYLRELQGLYDRYGFEAALYGHFGQGCIHTRIDFDLRASAGVETFRDFVEEAADLVVSYGGSLSGEHGDGQARAELLPRMYGDRVVQAFREFKAIWDPRNRMNPGKVVSPNRLDEELRLGTDYAPWEPVTFFSYPDDEYSFAHAGGLRCVGVGKCRREDGGTMCPSYMVTHEETHSTRGRARLLYEMLRGEVISDGWRSEAVRDALDLCLACKGCFGDCPVNVDMATYKAEFLAHHYAHRIRPAAHYSMGWLPVAARLAARSPRVVNALARSRLTAPIIKRAAGVDLRRELPGFAEETLVAWAARRVPRRDGPEVVLWPDTFTNHFAPEVGRAAVEVLEAAGYRVDVPRAPVCCGLTWITTGQLARARKVVRRTIDVLRPAIRAGTPVVGLEPSCTAVFRHDAADLFPHDEDVRRLRDQTRTFAEVLRDAEWEPPRVGGRAVVQAHCHHRAVMGIDADRDLMAAAGIDADVLDSGCCGLAGSFGFERGHYDVSVACAERVLLPAVRETSPPTPILADGFSCRTQIADLADRRAVHLAELLRTGIAS